MVTTLRESELGRLEPLGTGGMAEVFRAPELILPEGATTAWVYKRYRPKARPVPLFGMNQLVTLRDGFAPGQREAFDRSLNWPVRVVEDDGSGAAGVILPLIPPEYFLTVHKSSGATESKPAEAQFLFMDAGFCRERRLPFADPEQRRQLCRSLCYAFGLLDRADVVYGDLSARNILFRLSPRPAVLLVDTDAVRPQGGAAAFGAQPHSPDWEPPEALRAKATRSGSFSIQNKATDRYKLGLAILRILTPGSGCAGERDPARARGELPMNLYTLLQRSLSDDTTVRPTARTWYEEWTR